MTVRQQFGLLSVVAFPSRAVSRWGLFALPQETNTNNLTLIQQHPMVVHYPPTLVIAKYSTVSFKHRR